MREFTWKDGERTIAFGRGVALRAVETLGGPGYTLLRLGGSRADVSALEKAFAVYRAPFRVLDIPDAHVHEVYGRDLLLLRPDLHVTWRGDTPSEPQRLAAIATGH